MTEFHDDQYWGHMPPPPWFFQGGKHPFVPIMSPVGNDEEYEALVLSSMGEGPKGDKGDKLLFSDLTENDIDHIRQGITNSVNRSQDAMYTTTASTTQITIPIQDFDADFDMLFVDVNGLDLSEHDDYEIAGNKIVLTTAIPAGQDVHFRVLKYLIPDGDKSIQVTDDRNDYDTVAQMQADETLESGDICHTLGFHAASDGGAAWYKVVSHAVANGMDVIALNNGRFAILQITTPYIYSKTFGSTASGDAAELYAIQFATSNSLYFWDLENE